MAGQDTVTGMRRLERPREGRILAGVCVGLGRYTRVDPVVLRVGFAVLTLAGGPGILVYLAAYLLIPGDAGQAAALERALRRRFDADTVLVLLGVLLGATMVLLTMVGGLSEEALASVTVLALVLLVAHSRKVDFGAVARGLPEGLRGHPLRPDPPPPPGEAPVFLDDLDAGDAVRRAAPLPEGMVDLATLSEPEPAPPAEPARRPARKRSPLTSATLLGALAVGVAMIPMATAAEPGARGAQYVMAPALLVVGLGLLVGTWFGRARGLTTAGALLTAGLLTTTAVAEAPGDLRWGEVEWRPTDASAAERTYRLAAGDGRLDLTALPLPAGRRIRVTAHVFAGQLRVTVPSTVRVEVDGRVSMGDLTVDGRVTSGPNARTRTVLEPEAAGPPTVIELRIRARLGDVEVHRG